MKETFFICEKGNKGQENEQGELKDKNYVGFEGENQIIQGKVEMSEKCKDGVNSSIRLGAHDPICIAKVMNWAKVAS